MEDHPTVEDFERFLQASPRPSDASHNARIVRHLLKDCGICRQTLSSLPGGRTLLGRLFDIPSPHMESGDAEPIRSYNYDWAFARTARAVAASLAHNGPAPALRNPLAELTCLPEGEQLRQVGLSGRFANPEFIHYMLDHCHASRYQSPRRMLHWAHLALSASEACTAEAAGGEAALADLQTQTWRAFGNAQRVCFNMPEAEQAFAHALQRAGYGTGSCEIRALVLSQISSMRMCQNRFEEALVLAKDAERISRASGKMHLLATVLVQKAIVLIYAGQTEPAAEILRQAIPKIDREEDPHLFLAAHHNLARCYIDLDRPDEALALFVESRPLYQQCKDPIILLRATWQEGQLLREIGHLESAEAALLRSRGGFTEQGLAHETAMVSLDLADVYVKWGRTEDARQTIEEAMPIFRSLRVDREVLASLLRLRQAAGLEPAGEQ